MNGRCKVKLGLWSFSMAIFLFTPSLRAEMGLFDDLRGGKTPPKATEVHQGENLKGGDRALWVNRGSWHIPWPIKLKESIGQHSFFLNAVLHALGQKPDESEVSKEKDSRLRVVILRNDGDYEVFTVKPKKADAKHYYSGGILIPSYGNWGAEGIHGRKENVKALCENRLMHHTERNGSRYKIHARYVKEWSAYCRLFNGGDDDLLEEIRNIADEDPSKATSVLKKMAERKALIEALKLVCVGFVSKGQTKEAISLLTHWPRDLALTFPARLACINSILEAKGDVASAIAFLRATNQDAPVTDPAEQNLYALAASRYLDDGLADEASALMKIDKENDKIIMGMGALNLRERLFAHYLGQEQIDMEQVLRHALWGKDFTVIIIKLAKEQGTTHARKVLETGSGWRHDIYHASADGNFEYYYNHRVYRLDERDHLRVLLDGMDVASTPPEGSTAE